jgi:hypothetical protein
MLTNVLAPPFVVRLPFRVAPVVLILEAPLPVVTNGAVEPAVVPQPAASVYPPYELKPVPAADGKLNPL